MKRFVGWRALFAAPLLALVCFAISASGAGAAAPTGTRIVTPKPVLPHGAKQLGPVSPSATVSGAVVLQPRDESALTRFISQVTDKHSALFHHYLTPTSFAARFGPTPASIAAVRAQLRTQGLTVTNVSRSGLLLDFKAPASKVESAFRTGLARYKLADGSIGRARTGAIRVPASIAKYVTAVVGLDNTVKAHAEGLRPSTKAAATRAAAQAASFVHPAGSATPCSDASSLAEAFGGLTDDQIAHAYGADPLYGAGDTGSGQHVAVFELEPFLTSDVQTFDTCYFGATAAGQMISRLHVHNVDGGQTAGSGGGEAILDIQDVSAFAPGANIDVYEAPNTTFGSLDMYAQIVNDNVDKILTTSWGLCEQAVQQGEPGVQQAENLIFEQAAAQGMTVFSAAGDNGSNDCNAFRTTTPVDPVLSVDDPSSQPYVVSAGGTTMDDATQPASEHVWNDGAAWGAGGGGISESWAMPTWQAAPQVPGGVGSSANQNQVTAAQNFMGTGFCLEDNPGGFFENACREVPDVSANADEFTGAVTIYIAAFGGWNTIGGTSSAAPMWAGMLADVNESSTCQSNNATKSGVGFVNPLLYSVASNPTAYAASFNDITQGNNDPYGDANLFQAGTGYDMASGLGTPQLTAPNGGPGLAFYLCSQAPAATRPTVTNVSPNVGLTSAPDVPVVITGTNFFKNGVSNVSGVQVGNVNVPTGAINVVSNTEIDADLPPADLVIPPNDQTDGAGQVQIVVTLNDGESSVVNANTGFTYVDDNGTTAKPTVIGVHTYAGSETGGNTVDIYGAGFTGATHVTFGGIDATSFQIKHDWLIQATVPAYSNLTSCDQNGSFFGTGETAANDICQTQVVVSNATDSSQTSTILPLYEGAVAFSSNGVRLPADAAHHVDLDDRRPELARERAGRLGDHDRRLGLQPRRGRLGQLRRSGAGELAAVLQPRQRDGHGDPDPGARLPEQPGQESHPEPGERPGHRPDGCRPVELDQRDVRRHSDGVRRGGHRGLDRRHAGRSGHGWNADRHHRLGLREPGEPRPVPGCRVAVLARHAVQLQRQQQHGPDDQDRASEPGGRRHTGVHGHGLLRAHVGEQRLRRRVLPVPAGRSEDHLDHSGLRSVDRWNGGDDPRPEPRLRDRHLVRLGAGGDVHEPAGVPRLRPDRHGHGDRAGELHPRAGHGQPRHRRERGYRRTLCDRALHLHAAARADGDRSEDGERQGNRDELARRHQLRRHLLARVHLRHRGDPEGEGVERLALRRLHGRVHRQEHVLGSGEPGPVGDGEVHAQELRRPTRQGQVAVGCEEGAEVAFLLGRQDPSRLLEQGEARPRHLDEAEGGNPPEAQRQGEAHRQQGQEEVTRTTCRTKLRRARSGGPSGVWRKIPR
jgi:hypothetical protein